MAQLTDTLVSGDERVTGMIYGTQAGNYATCSEAGATKTATIPGFVLTTGVHVRIKFSANNTATTPTLNVSGTGAKSIKVKGNNLAAAGDLAANGIYEFVYDGTNWELSGAVCGKATTANYGYVQLATGDMNGQANVDGVAVSKNHTHSQYLPKSGGTMTGGITLPTNFYYQNNQFGIDAKNSDIVNANSIYFNDESTDTDEGIHFKRGDNTDNYDSLWIDNGKICFVSNHAISAHTQTASAYKVPWLPASISDNQVVLTNGTAGALKTLAASSLSVGSATTATTATKVSGTQVGQDSNVRHLWFSTTVEEQRGYIDSLMYRTDINRITANISGYASGLHYSNEIEHQGNKNTKPLHRIASFPDSLSTGQSPHADNSLILHLFSKGYSYSDYGIVMITVKMDSSVDSTHPPTINISWKLRSSGISADAVQAVCIYSGGLWHVDVFFIIQHQYQLMVFNKLGTYSGNGNGPNGGWNLYSSTDKSGSEKEIYTDYSGSDNTFASWKLYNLSSYYRAGNKLGDGGIVGTANAYDPNYTGTNSIGAALTSHNHGLQISTKRPAGVDANSFSIFMGNYNGTNTWKANLGLENKNSTDSEPTFWLASIRSQNCTYTPSGGTATSLPWYAGSYSPGITFGGKDTKGVISLRYDQVDNYGKMTLAAGSGKGENGAPDWWFSIRGLHNTTYILPPLVSGFTNKYAINISGTAAAADTAAEAGYATALKVTAAIGSSIKPVYIGANGIPQVIPNDSTYSDYLTLNVLNARTASEASTANKWKTGRSFTIKDDSLAHAGTSTTGVDGSGNVVLRLPTEITLTKVNATTFNGTATTATKLQSTNVGSSTKPVFFNANGVPEAVGTVPHGSMTYLNLNVDNAYSADAVGGVRLVIGEFGGDANTIYLD